MYKAPNLPFDKHCFFGKDDFLYSEDGRYWQSNAREKISKQFNKLILHPKLVNGNEVVFVREPSSRELLVDGVVTDNPDILLCFGTADCIPVMLADYKQELIAIAHAGWRGALSGVVENTINLMLEKGSSKENIIAALGPCIQKESFEVKEDVLNLFLEKNQENTAYFNQKSEDTYLLDLEAFVFDKLKNIGITDISTSNIDTYKNNDKYFSHRYNTHYPQYTKIPHNYSVICL